MAGGCFAAGIPMGSKDKMLLGLKDNPKGHWEHKDYLRLNDYLLNINGGTWNFPKPILKIDQNFMFNAENLGYTQLTVKDPRFCLTLPQWVNYGKVEKLIVMLRDPNECYASMEIRGNDFEKNLWRIYLNSLLAAIHEYNLNVMVVEFQDIFVHRKIVGQYVQDFLNAPIFDNEKFSSFIDDGLWHNKGIGPWDPVDQKIREELIELNEVKIVYK